tara:strand:+ start:106 stop:660 length:555 start_codon:yes stop_codon:yes gene_type:complete
MQQINLIKKIHLKKYKRILLNNDQIINFVKFKYKLLPSILIKKLKKASNKTYEIRVLNKNIINTEEYLFDIYINKKKINNKILIKFYQKFSANLKLKKIYSLKFKKKNNLNTNVSAYLYLAERVLGLKNINKLQKFNFLSKINDLVIINLKKINTKEKIILFLKLLKVEHNYFKRINENINNIR